MPASILLNPLVATWLKNVWPTETCVNAIMSITSPALYERGVETTRKIQETNEELFKTRPARHNPHWPNAIEAVNNWPSPASGMGVISNRITPSHRDDNGHKPWYDYLVAAGFHTDATFTLPEVKAHFKYTPGCLIALCGRVLRHECLEWEGVDRICVTRFFRYEEQERLCPSTVDPEWVNMEPIMGICDKQFQEANWASYHAGKWTGSD